MDGLKFRAKTADDQASLESADWTQYQELEDQQAQAIINQVGNSRWVRLQLKLFTTETRPTGPKVDKINQIFSGDIHHYPIINTARIPNHAPWVTSISVHE